MTQVWMLRNSDTDIHLFNREDHLLPSIRISYCACKDVVIDGVHKVGETIFTVTGKRNGESFEEFVIFKRLPVWTEPCHL